MPSLVFDIETIGEDYQKMDKETKQALTYWIERESMSETEYKKNVDRVKERLGLSPLTGQIVSIAIYNPDTQKGAVYFQAPGKKIRNPKKRNIEFVAADEKTILKNFWTAAEKYDEFVTYNGQSFDVPFIIIRSAVNRVKPTKNIMSNRYYRSQDLKAKHVDLMDQMTFYGAVYSKPKLQLVCRAFGVKSPKDQGISGNDVGKLFQKGYYLEIAKYNMRDVIATARLYKIWREYFKFEY
ncbi:ribonuclease H-like domain-containing protein [Patescibacteria group bacterium]|nr:ribonuclease H-like domain-containing protein [Patescibacteria group bacterium]